MAQDLFGRLRLDKTGKDSLYLNLARQIEAMILSGSISAGERLPAQREFAHRLNINLTTVTRAFRVLHDRGLIISRAGRGTTVISQTPRDKHAAYSSAPLSNLLDLTINRPATNAFMDALPGLFEQLPGDTRLASLQDYHPPEGAPWLREIIAAWLGASPDLPPVQADQVIITSGAQHALDCVLRSLCLPGDCIIADSITYQGIQSLCDMLHLRLVGVPMDAGGMIPERLQQACDTERPKAIVLVPTLHNPTAITLDETRRSQLAQIAYAQGIPIIEDDVYRPLHESPGPSLCSLAPDLNFYIGGFSKCIAPGLRTGFIVAPPDRAVRPAIALRNSNWCSSPLSMWLTAVLIESGKATGIIRRQQEELAARQAMLADILGEFQLSTYKYSTHAWLSLPPGWKTSTFVMAARRSGVAVLGSDLFAVGSDDELPPAVRINVGAPRSRDTLHKALNVLAATLLSHDRNLAGAF